MNPFRNIYRSEKFFLTVLLLITAAGLSYSESLHRWDMTIYDLFSGMLHRPPSDNIVIIAIDEHSLSEYGRWPWSRKLHAALIDKLSKGDPQAIGYDIIFSEENSQVPGDDAALAVSLKENGKVILPIFHEQDKTKGPLKVTFPLPALAKSSADLGHVDIELDADGMVRRAYLKAGLHEAYWPALALAMLQSTETSLLDTLPGICNTSLHAAETGNYMGDFQIFVPYRGPPGHYPHISFADFLQPGFDPSIVKDKFVLVGATALGLGDNLPTPVSGKSVPMSGVEFNANILDALQTGSAVIPIGQRLRILLTSALITVTMLLYPLLSPRQSLFGVSLFFSLTLAISMFLLRFSHMWFPPATALLSLSASYPLWTWRRLEDTIKQLFREKEKAQVTLGSIGDSVITTDLAGKIEYMNPVAESLTGYSFADANGQSLQDIFPITDKDEALDLTTLIEFCLKEKRIIHLQEKACLVNRGGEKRDVRTSVGLIHDQEGKPQGVVFGITDITETRKILQQVAYQASHDNLTDLPNRSLIQERLNNSIVRAKKHELMIAVLFLDLDLFKKVNDQLGHKGGDQIIKDVAQRLQEICGPQNTISRIGGDEFLILVEQVEQIETITDFTRNLQAVLETPFIVDDQEIFITSSIGISIFPKDGDSVGTLIRNADTAMYRAKEKGGNTYRFFSLEMNEWIQDRLNLELKLRNAIKNNELEVYYQPKYSVNSGLIVGVEGLLRWKCGEQGMVMPDRFIPVAEDTGLIIPIGEWVLLDVCRQAKIWQETGLPVRAAVNLSSIQFERGDIVKLVTNALTKTGLDPSFLELEITESLIMKNLKKSTSALNTLKNLGVRISIDDFGTGYSSLSYLQHFPVDQLKIDKSFVNDIITRPGDNAIIKAIITMAHSMGLGVIAEGVETESQYAMLKKQNCDEIQGYLFSRPLPIDKMTKLLRNHSLHSRRLKSGD